MVGTVSNMSFDFPAVFSSCKFSPAASAQDDADCRLQKQQKNLPFARGICGTMRYLSQSQVGSSVEKQVVEVAMSIMTSMVCGMG